MIYNYIKCESVIAKIMADLDSTEVRQRTSDIREWIFEAIDKIGAPMQYINRESGDEYTPILKIEDNQVPLPNDLVHLDGVAYSLTPEGPWIAMATNSSVFKEPRRKPKGRVTPEYKKLMTSQSQLYTINGVKCSEKFMEAYVENKPEYFVKPGWIVLNRDKGFVKIAYKAIATDERGYPLIPDLSSYQEAVYWYCVMKLSFSKWMKGTLGGKGVNTGQNIYTYIQQQWNFYRNQAYAEAMMPTADDMKTIKNEWNKLVPEFESDQTFFKDINKEQQIYTDYYHGY